MCTVHNTCYQLSSVYACLHIYIMIYRYRCFHIQGNLSRTSSHLLPFRNFEFIDNKWLYFTLAAILCLIYKYDAVPTDENPLRQIDFLCWDLRALRHIYWVLSMPGQWTVNITMLAKYTKRLMLLTSLSYELKVDWNIQGSGSCEEKNKHCNIVNTTKRVDVLNVSTKFSLMFRLLNWDEWINQWLLYVLIVDTIEINLKGGKAYS